jgi:hypothetical protein
MCRIETPKHWAVNGFRERYRVSSSDDIRHQLVFKPDNLVLQNQLFLFQPGDLHLVHNALRGQGSDGGVEIAMLQFEHFQLRFIAIIIHRLSAIAL